MPDEYHDPSDDDTESPAKYLTVVVTAQPVSAVGGIGGQVQFTAAYSAVIPAQITVVWQLRTGSTNPVWRDLVETTNFYEGVATTTLTVKNIDNFMASWTSRDFRLKILFAGTVPTFTSAASLTIPISASWSPYVGAMGYAVAPNTAITDTMVAPVVTGLTAGPLTYSWAFQSGRVMGISNAAIANPFFSCTFVAGHTVDFSIWRCTISDGVNSVTTDPIYVVASFADPLFVGTVSIPGIFSTGFFDFFWLNFLFPPNPLVGTATQVYLVPLRCAVAPGFTLHASTFDPLTMQYFFSYDETTASNPGCAQFALYRCQLENPAGNYGYLVGQLANPAFKGFVIAPFPLG